ncbi:MAG: alpha/beta hydrolase [bacterium]|nr:alpha/beta hydrolase [bacterium]
MRENSIRYIDSKGASIGVESYSGPEVLERGSLALALLSADCEQALFASFLGDPMAVFSMDIRGQVVRNSEVSGGFSIAEFNADFEAVRSALGIEKLVLHGYSQPGFFAVHYALANPDKVSALILTEPALFNDKADLLKRAELAEKGDGVESAKAMFRYVAPHLSEREIARAAKHVMRSWQSPEAMAQVYRTRAENALCADDLGKLKIPTLLLAGTASEMNFHIRKAADAIPCANVWWIADANHVDLVSDRAAAPEIAEIITCFLRGVGVLTPA